MALRSFPLKSILCRDMFSPKRKFGGCYQKKRQWTLSEKNMYFVFVKSYGEKVHVQFYKGIKIYSNFNYWVAFILGKKIKNVF